MENALNIVSLVMGVISLLSVVYLAGTRLAAIEVKVDTIWDFLIRRAMSEAVRKGIGEMNSPLSINAECRHWMDPLLPEIVEYYNKNCNKLSDRDALMELERKFGDRIVSEVCIPHNLSQGACLLIAADVIKRTNGAS